MPSPDDMHRENVGNLTDVRLALGKVQATQEFMTKTISENKDGLDKKLDGFILEFRAYVAGAVTRVEFDSEKEKTKTRFETVEKTVDSHAAIFKWLNRIVITAIIAAIMTLVLRPGLIAHAEQAIMAPVERRQ